MAHEYSDEVQEYDYFANKHTGRTYISRAFPDRDLDWENPETGRSLRILSKVFDSEDCHEFVKVKGEVVLRVTEGGRQEIKVTFYEDTRELKRITFQRFEAKSGKPHPHSFTFQGAEIEKIYNLLRLINYIELQTGDKVRLDDQVVNDWLVTEAEKRHYLLENQDMVAEIAKHHITKQDVIAFGYRKKQLEIFEGLLTDAQFFSSKKQEWNARGNEATWQTFFETNPWIFGYGLSYVFTSRLDDKKLEQVTSGYTFAQSGKRTDALMKTRGYISSLCFVEIKTHQTPLMDKQPYRPECWRISDELAGSVAQIQKTVEKAIRSIQSRVELFGPHGQPTGEIAYLYQPKAYVVIGSLEEFLSVKGVNEQKHSSFELFRHNITNPEIITFDELYERAKCIVYHSESELPEAEEEYPKIEDDLPF